MGEYLNHRKHGQVKLGTCEDLYYTTFKQFVEDVQRGNFSYSEAMEYLQPDTFRYRFPFPDEKLDMGSHDDFNRGVMFNVPIDAGITMHHTTMHHNIENAAGRVAFSTPCVQDYEKDFHKEVYQWCVTKRYTVFEITQQKLCKHNDTLRLETVIRCPYCKASSRLSLEEITAMHVYSKSMPHLFNGMQKEIIAIALDGYNETINLLNLATSHAQ